MKSGKRRLTGRPALPKKAKLVLRFPISRRAEGLAPYEKRALRPALLRSPDQPREAGGAL
jgi:hypothetical protein